jgi:hypothetical protein
LKRSTKIGLLIALVLALFAIARRLEITPELCRGLGFVEITNRVQPLELERNIGEPLPFKTE